tara:strand:+ start:239 stop:1162 length:924 start_codon:yes stop_codon:yes gene_type:complete
MADIATAQNDNRTYGRGVNYATKQAKLEKEEKELEALMAKQYGTKEEEEEVQEEEEVTKVEAKEPEPEVQEEEDKEDDSKLTGEEKSFKKRYGDLRRHMAKKEQEWEDRFKALENKSSDGIRPPSSDEDIEAWASKNPGIASIVETIAAKKASEKFAAADARLRDLDEAQEEVNRAKAENIIRDAHSDFDELRNGDAFHDWVDEQPKWVQNALYENADDPASVIRVLDLYKTDNGLTPSAKKAKAKDAAKTIGKSTRTSIDDNGAGSMIKESDVKKMSDKEFEDKYDKIQEAMASGKFVYDISGKAR